MRPFVLLLAFMVLAPMVLADITVDPMNITASELRTRNVVINVTFPLGGGRSSDLDSVNFLALTRPIGRYVRIKVVENPEIILPHGFSPLQDKLCPGSTEISIGCVTASGATVATISLTKVPIFDVRVPQQIEIIFDAGLFPIGRTADAIVPFMINPDPVETSTFATALALPLLATDIVGAFVMPTTMDLAPLVLIPENTCALNSERAWMLFKPTKAYLPLATTMFDGVVAAVSIMGALVVLIFIFVTLCGRGPEEPLWVTQVRQLFPFALANLWLFFAGRGVGFASGFLMGSRAARDQVFGAFVLILGIFSIIAMRRMLITDYRWEFCLSPELPPNPKGCKASTKKWWRFRGFWMFEHTNREFAVSRRRAGQLFPREFDVGTRMRINVPVYWMLSITLVVIQGGSPTNGQTCFIHSLGLGIGHILMGVYVMRWRVFRSYVLVWLSFLIRIGTGLTLLALAAGPENAEMRENAYFISAGVAIGVAICRILVWVLSTLLQSPPSIEKRQTSFVTQGARRRGLSALSRRMSIRTNRTATAAGDGNEEPLLDEQLKEILAMADEEQKADELAERNKTEEEKVIFNKKKGTKKRKEGDDMSGWDLADVDAAVPNDSQASLPTESKQSNDSFPTAKEESQNTEQPPAATAVPVQEQEEEDDEEGIDVEAVKVGDNMALGPNSNIISMLDDAASNAAKVSRTRKLTGISNEPAWMHNASRTRIKAQPEDSVAVEQPLWFPKERPAVRSENLPDVPLQYSPYSVRNKD